MAQVNQADWSPIDWPESLQELRRIDNLLRCSICYEYFDTAVLFQECSHNYCSLCIRKAMVYDPQCPTCFEKTSSNDLKCNRVLDELVKNFVNIRSRLLDIINKTSSQSDITTAQSEKKNDIEMSDDSASNFEVTPKQLRMNLRTRLRTKKGKSPRLTPRNKRKRPLLVNSDSDDNDDVEDADELQAVETDPVKSPANTSQPTKNAEAPTSFVECPVCGELISSNNINSHLDLCLVSGEKKRSLRSRKKARNMKSDQEPVAAPSSTKSPPRDDSQSSSSNSKMTKEIAGANTYISAGQKRKPIPGTVYAILSDKQLKQKLKQWNLSIQGNRKTLIKRHQEFVVAYNAQCDSMNPKPVSAIVKELEIKEKRKTAKLFSAISTGPNLNLNRDASEEQVDKVHKQYLQENKGQFEKLIEEIKKRKKQRGKSVDKSTKSVVIIDEDSKQDEGKESENIDQLRQNQEVKNDSSEDDDGIVDSSKIRSEEQNVPCKSSPSVENSPHTDTEDSEDQNNQQLQTENSRNLNDSEPSPEEGSRQDKIYSALQGTEKSAKQVPDPPLMANLASINESDSSNEDADGDEDADDGDEDGDDGDDSIETNDDTKNDQDWELTPTFEIANSDEECNENGDSDEDLFATTPRIRTKSRSLRRKKGIRN